MTPEQHLRDGLNFAISADIQIVRGCIAIWNGTALEAVDATGAVLFQRNLLKPGFQLGWLKQLTSILEIDDFWLRRFWLGWDRNFQVQVEHIKNKKSYLSDDIIAKFGIALAKENIG